MIRMLGIAVLCSVAALPAYGDCRCLYAGGEAKLGETVCLKISDKPRLARCEMEQNISSWTVLDEACDQNQSQISDKKITLVQVAEE